MEVGDVWRLSFQSDYWLVAQEIVAPEEPSINGLLATHEPLLLDGVDGADVAKSVVVIRNMRKEVSRIQLEDDGTLTLTFDDERFLELPTGTDIVDWQWCLNRTGNSPYTEFLVACFWKGEVEIKR